VQASTGTHEVWLATCTPRGLAVVSKGRSPRLNRTEPRGQPNRHSVTHVIHGCDSAVAFDWLIQALDSTNGSIMRHTLRAFVCVVATGFLAGCTSTNGESAALAKLHANAETQANKAKAEVQVADQASQDYSYAQRAQFVDKTKRDLDAIHDELERLTANVEKFDGAAKVDAKAKLAVVQDKWTQAKKQFDRAESSTESGWDDVQRGVKGAYHELKESFDTTRQWLSDKIAP